MKFHIGQTLWLSFREKWKGQIFLYTITKVGTKWLEVANENHVKHRIDKEGMRIDGGGYGFIGDAYLSRESYEAEQNAAALWSKFNSAIQYKSAKQLGLTVEKIGRAAADLGLDEIRNVAHELGKKF